MRWLLSLMLAWPLALFGAAGDITGVAIETNGWQVLVYVDGLATNGTYASFGFGANNSISGNEKLTVNLTSQGYDNTGTATTVPRTVYGTLRVRFPYPSEAFADTLVVGSDVRLRIALSDWVYAGDSNITANISAGLYTQGTANAAGTGLTVTNLSTQPYPKVIANWSWPGWNRETGSSMRLRAVGFHAHAKEGKPLAAMKFIATDESGDAVTSTQTAMTIDRTLPDIFPTGEYVADISQASFASLDRVRCDFVAYPWVGDASSVLDTTANTYTQPTPLPASITNLCDRLNVYTDAIAVVAVGGNDTNGQITNVAPASVNSAHYFASIAGAVTKAAAYNNSNFSHNDAGGAIIYVKNGITAWTGGTHSITAIPRAWTIVTTYPGDTVTLSTDTGTDDIADRIKIEGIELAFGSITPFFNTQLLWLNDCLLNSTGTAVIQSCNVVWVTHSNVTNYVQGLGPFSTQNTAFNCRGNDLTGLSAANNLFHTWIGNTHRDTNGPNYTLKSNITGQNAPIGYHILYNNFFGGFNSSASLPLDAARTFTVTNGMAIVQNVFEKCISSSAALANIGSDNTLNFTNLIIWHNVFVGERIAGFGYNDSGSAAAYRYLWSVKNNICDVTGFKTDTFTTANAARVGNWPVMWNVGSSGNVWTECRVNTAAGAFPPEFNGLSGINPSSLSLSGTNIVDYCKWIDRKSYNGISDGAGGGNYRVHNVAPQQGLTAGQTWVLPFDLEGHYRGLSDPPGAYASANPRKAAGFFAP